MTYISSFYEFLQEAINDRGTNALAQVTECAATETDLEIKAPCIAALACWGDAGFENMIKIALANNRSNDVSAAIKTLAQVAAGKPLTKQLAFVHHQGIVDSINQVFLENDFSSSARKRLVELIMAIPGEDLLIPLGAAFTQLSLTDPDIVGEIVHALSSKWLGFGVHQLDSFENLLKEAPEDEPLLHSFLEQCPQMLEPMAVQVWSKPDFHGFREPDFLIRRSDDSYLVVEIENATKSIVTQSGQPSAQVTQAVKQVHDYRSFILEKMDSARHHFPRIHDPDALVVIGLEGSLRSEQVKALQQENHSRSKLRIVGFDWILERARSVLSNVTSSKIEVIKNYRVV